MVVQSMTNTDTADIAATVAQVKLLHDTGSELVRVTVNNDAAARALPHIVEQLAQQDCHVPLVGDFHFNGHKLLTRRRCCARRVIGTADARIQCGCAAAPRRPTHH